MLCKIVRIHVPFSLVPVQFHFFLRISFSGVQGFSNCGTRTTSGTPATAQ
jgi:hypothetical protein